MEFYFFSSVPKTLKPAFTNHYTRQNLKVVQVASAVILCISVTYAILNLLFHFGDLAPENQLYLKLNTGMIIASALTFGASQLSRLTYSFFRTAGFIQILCFGYGLYYVLSCMGISFLQQENPQSTLIMYLLGLTVVAILWNFEYWQHLLLALIIESVFIIGLQFIPPLPATEEILNYLISAAMIIFFFVAARMIYSFRASHFLQLAEIEEKSRKLEQLSQSRSELMGVVAHDLLSPFASIESLIKLLRKKKLSPEQQEEYFELSLSQCQASRHLINGLLEAARYENEEPFATGLVEMNAYLEEVYLKWLTQLKTRQLTFTGSATPLYANLNRERFGRVLDNLLTNAIKFTPEHGQLSIDLKQKGQQILLKISDNGIGIPENLQPYLFQRFSRARRKGLQGQASTGLGLSIAQKLVTQHGGSIQVRSTENEGTTFEISLPAAKGKENYRTLKPDLAFQERKAAAGKSKSGAKAPEKR